MQLLEAVEWLHSRSVMHRDMKLCNVLMTQHGHLKLCDFGLARYVSAYEENYTPGVVTLWYRCGPPILILLESRRQVGEAITEAFCRPQWGQVSWLATEQSQVRTEWIMSSESRFS